MVRVSPRSNFERPTQTSESNREGEHAGRSARCYCAWFSLTSCGISVHSDGAVLESIHEIGPLEGESRLQAKVHLDVGHLAIDQGDASDLYEVELSFDGRLLKPHLVVKREGDLARLEYEVRQGWMDGSPNTRLYLRLNPLVELDLLAQTGVGDSKIDLTGLSTRSFSLNNGVGETTLSMLEPNRISCDRVTINSGVGSLNVTGLGNFGFKELVFNGGVGTAKLDFSGEWSQDGDVDIDVGVGSLELRISTRRRCRDQNRRWVPFEAAHVRVQERGEHLLQ